MTEQIIKHNNATLKCLKECINRGDYNGDWIKIRINEEGKIVTTKLEKDLFKK